MKIERLINPSTSSEFWFKKGNKRYYHREDGPAYINGTEGFENWWYYNVYYATPEQMPLNLFLAYVKWEYKKNG